MQETSQIAYEKINREGIKNIHYTEILSTLKVYGDLTSFGISRNSTLTYHQTARRMGELKEKNLIKEVCKFRDSDGSIRMKYRLV